MLSLKIAFRYLKAKKSHTAVNVITLTAVIGVALATMAMVLVLSIFNGFSDLALSQLSSLDPVLSVVPAKGKFITDADSVVKIIEAQHGISAAMPVVSERALLIDGTARVPVIVKGVPTGYETASGIESIIIAGEYADHLTDGTPAIQLSVGVANSITSYPSLDRRLQLLAPRRNGSINPANPAAAFRSLDAAFSGVFRVSNPDIDNDLVILPLEAARDLLDLEEEATAVEVGITPDASERKTAKKLQEILGNDFKVLTRLEQRENSFRMISVEKWVTLMMLTCILAIALFNVISTLLLLAIEKKDNMWTLRAMGASPHMTNNIFIAEGFLVTIMGGVIGTVAGVVLGLAQQVFHLVKLSGDSGSLTIDYYPVRVDFADIVIVIGIVIVMALAVSGVARFINSRNTSRRNCNP